MEESTTKTPQTKKEISQYVRRLMNKRKYKKLEEFLLQRLEAGERDAIILGSLINLYKKQGNRWQKIEELSREYLTLKPGNSFAQRTLELSLKIQGKKKKTSEFQKDEHQKNICQFRKQIYEESISIEDITDELFVGFTEFEKTILLAELYSHLNLANNAIQLLKNAAKVEGITQEEKKIVTQALQLAKAGKMGPVQKRMKWNYLSGEEKE